MIRNEFPPEALFLRSDPEPTRTDPERTWVEWDVGDLAGGTGEYIYVTVEIDANVVPSTTIEIWHWIYNHLGEPVDEVVTTFHVMELEFGDAPEAAVAYPALGVMGEFPTCLTEPMAGWVDHGNDGFSAYFGPAWDAELDGNAGVCPLFTPNQYDRDECFQDGDAGLIIPEPYTIMGAAGNENVLPCPKSQGTALGDECTMALWGQDVDIVVNNGAPNMPVYVNVLMDWDQSGKWAGNSSCAGAVATEHVLVDFVIPAGYVGPLSGLNPPPFLIGPNHGFVWSRFSITEHPVGAGWDGGGRYKLGETEDYLLRIDEEADYKMHFPQLPDPHGWDVNATEPAMVADDFLCTATGLINNVVFWGSWRDDEIGQIYNIHLSIHKDDRSGTFSKPGELLWQWDTNNFFVEEVFPPADQGWSNPALRIEWTRPNHKRYFRFEVPIPNDIAFVQEEGNIYWLDLSFAVEGGAFGVKTSLNHFEDDAVWLYGVPPVGWQELIDPSGESLDLAFFIGGDDLDLDFGDAPDPTYPTLVANDGGRHVIGGPFMGLGVDPEPDGQPTLRADGDDDDGNDDEDGIVFADPLSQGGHVTVTVDMQPSNVDCLLNAWVDFDGDGAWSMGDPEQIFTDEPLAAGAEHDLGFDVPADAVIGTSFARFRCSTEAGLEPTGLAQDGEVEDYVLLVTKPPEWYKYINDQVWYPDISVTVQTSDTIVILDRVFSGAAFEIEEAWDPDHLKLVNWAVEPAGVGLVAEGDGFLSWKVGAGEAQNGATLKKEFHIEPCDWTDALLREWLWVDGKLVEERPVKFEKTPPDLWISSGYEPEVLPGANAGFALYWANYGGYENDVMIRNEFPPEALFMNANPEPDRQDPNGTWAEWDLGDLAEGAGGVIDVNVTIGASVPPSTTIKIWDWIYNHLGEPVDEVVTEFHVTGPDTTADLGDAPDSTNNHSDKVMTAYTAAAGPVLARYPTVFAGPVPVGPKHWNLEKTAWLGPAISAEDEADTGPDQDGVNNIWPPTDTPDKDEFDDGVGMDFDRKHCVPTTITFEVTVPPGAPLMKHYANIWLDVDRNGAWGEMHMCKQQGDAPEWAVHDMEIPAKAPGTYTYTTPQFLLWNLKIDQPMWMRITLSNETCVSHSH